MAQAACHNDRAWHLTTSLVETTCTDPRRLIFLLELYIKVCHQASLAHKVKKLTHVRVQPQTGRHLTLLLHV